MTTYKVTAPFINVKTNTRDGMRVIGLGVDSTLPADVEASHIKHLLTQNLIAEVPEPEPVKPAPPKPEPPKPSAPAAKTAAAKG